MEVESIILIRAYEVRNQWFICNYLSGFEFWHQMNVFVLSSLADRCGAVQPCCQPFIEGERDIWADLTEQDSHGLLSTSPGPTCFRHHCGLPPFAFFYLRNSRENLKISERFSARKYWYQIMANSYTMVKIDADHFALGSRTEKGKESLRRRLCYQFA